MESIKEIIISFLFCVSFGTYLLSIITPSKLTGAGFIRLITLISLATLVVAMIIFSTLNHPYKNQVYLFSGLIVVLFIGYYKFHQDDSNIWMKLIYSLICLFYLAIANSYVSMNTSNFHYLILSALFIGSVNYMMTLGHYYLVVPRLSEWPLLKTMKIFWIILGLKIFVSIWGYQSAHNFFLEGTQIGAGYMFNWVLLTMRILWGYVALGILSYFAYRLCKMRSIQSATGVFYVMVFFVFVGEMISSYLFYNFGLFL